MGYSTQWKATNFKFSSPIVARLNIFVYLCTTNFKFYRLWYKM